MTNLVVEQDNLAKIMREWLAAQGVPTDERIEIIFLDGEALIRPQPARHADLDKWLDEAMLKYDSVLRRLAE